MSNKINLLVFSKDRAAQLDLLLRSIEAYANGIFNIYILYTYSNDSFKEGYLRLRAANWNNPTVWWNQLGVGLGEKTKQIFLDWQVHNSYIKWIAFSTDDQVFFRPLPVSSEELFSGSYLPSNSEEVFSFRLGFNTIEQDIHQGTKQPPLNLWFGRESWIAWNPHFYHPFHNYGYPLAVDTHVFHTDLINEIFDREVFSSTNELETKMQGYRHKINLIKSFKHSVAVNVPANNLSQVTISGRFHPFSTEALNTEFLAGKRISLDSISKTNIIGAHQELSYQLA